MVVEKLVATEDYFFPNWDFVNGKSVVRVRYFSNYNCMVEVDVSGGGSFRMFKTIARKYNYQQFTDEEYEEALRLAKKEYDAITDGVTINQLRGMGFQEGALYG